MYRAVKVFYYGICRYIESQVYVYSTSSSSPGAFVVDSPAAWSCRVWAGLGWGSLLLLSSACPVLKSGTHRRLLEDRSTFGGEEGARCDRGGAPAESLLRCTMSQTAQVRDARIRASAAANFAVHVGIRA